MSIQRSLRDNTDSALARTGQLQLSFLRACDLNQARTLLAAGAQLCIELDIESSSERPLWRATLMSKDGSKWVMVKPKSNVPRELRSVQRVYQLSKNLGVKHVSIPIEQ